MRANEFIVEVLDSNPNKPSNINDRWIVADDGTTVLINSQFGEITVQIYGNREYWVHVEFTRNGFAEITGEGNQFKVFKIVWWVLQKWMRSGPQPQWITFSSETKSRTVLYQRMISRFSSQYGYRSHELSDPDVPREIVDNYESIIDHVFVLSKIKKQHSKQDVAEGSLNEWVDPGAPCAHCGLPDDKHRVKFSRKNPNVSFINQDDEFNDLEMGNAEDHDYTPSKGYRPLSQREAELVGFHNLNVDIPDDIYDRISNVRQRMARVGAGAGKLTRVKEQVVAKDTIDEAKKRKRKRNHSRKSITTGWWGGYWGDGSEGGDGGGMAENTLAEFVSGGSGVHAERAKMNTPDNAIATAKLLLIAKKKENIDK